MPCPSSRHTDQRRRPRAAVDAGLDLALAADLRIVSTTAKLIPGPRSACTRAAATSRCGTEPRVGRPPPDLPCSATPSPGSGRRRSGWPGRRCRTPTWGPGPRTGGPGRQGSRSRPAPRSHVSSRDRSGRYAVGCGRGGRASAACGRCAASTDQHPRARDGRSRATAPMSAETQRHAGNALGQHIGHAPNTLDLPVQHLVDPDEPWAHEISVALLGR